MSKQIIAVLFGGQSSEHEISCLSAANIIEQIDTERYELVLVGITKEGHWVRTDS
ncbi:MAG: D-alanine--D-alanine ligase A, partial [Lachnospiraceae bacterium]